MSFLKYDFSSDDKDFLRSHQISPERAQEESSSDVNSRRAMFIFMVLSNTDEPAVSIPEMRVEKGKVLTLISAEAIIEAQKKAPAKKFAFEDLKRNIVTNFDTAELVDSEFFIGYIRMRGIGFLYTDAWGGIQVEALDKGTVYLGDPIITAS